MRGEDTNLVELIRGDVLNTQTRRPNLNVVVGIAGI
jgi:hypothetical protein